MDDPGARQVDVRGAFGYVARQLAAFPSFTIQSSLLILLMAVVNLPLPMLNMLAIDVAIPSGATWPLVAIGILAFATRAGASGFQVFQNHLVWRLMTAISHRLRRDMIGAMLAAPFPRFVSGEVPGYVGRLGGDVERIEQMILNCFRFVLRPVGMIAVMVTVMCLLDVTATILVMTSAPVAIFATRRLRHQLGEREREVLEHRQALQERVTECLDNVRVVRAFNDEDRQLREIGAAIDAYGERAVAHATREQGMQSVVEILVNLPWLLLVAIGGFMVADGDLTLGTFMAFIAFEQLLRSPLGQLAYYLQHVRSELVGPERVESVKALPREDSGDARPPIRGEVRIEDLGFGYEADRPVFSGLDLVVARGERVALVGPSGAGKSTLVNLLLGFYRPRSGRILIDGQDLAAIDLAHLRRHVGVVFQDNPLFDATVRENLVLDGDFDEAAIRAALAAADAEAFVDSLPDRLDTLIGVEGMKLSGGQRQRLAIARALLCDPALILLDEATSSLDSLSENQIRAALDRLLAGRTSIAIAHRLSTVVDADRICYLDRGRIVEEGTHAELLDRDGAYARLFRSQTEGLLEDG